MAVAPELVKPPTMSIGDIVEEYEYRLQTYGPRDAAYDIFDSYYRGANSNGKGGLPILAANAQGRPLLRPVGESINTQRTYSSQRLSSVVDDYAALMGRLPTSRVEPPSNDEEGEKKAELLTKYLYSTYELSRMGYQQAQAGFYLSCLGDTVYVLEPALQSEDAMESKRVVWNVVNPRTVYPSFYGGYRRFEVYDAIVAEVWAQRDLYRQWGVMPESEGQEDCTVLTYISPRQRTVLVGSRRPQEVSNVEWDLGFCPAVWAFNKVTGVMGMSDIGQSLQQQDFLDFAFNVWADGIVHMTYPMVAIKNPVNVSEAPVIGPGAPPVLVQGDGDIIVKNSQGDPRALEAIIAQTLKDIMAATGTSDVRQEGQMKSSIVTGRAVQSVQGPQSTRLEYKQQVLGEALEMANSMTLRMQERAPVLRSFRGPIFGRYRGSAFQEMFDASKDIEGWWRTSVRWQALVGMNPQQKAAVAYEGLVAHLWDDIEAREIAGVEDPLGMRKRIEVQLLQEAQMQAQIAQMQPGQQGQPGQGQPQQQGGFRGLGPAAPFQQQGQSIGAPGQPGKPLGGPGQQEDRTQPLRAALGKVAGSLKGHVWLALDGQVLVGDAKDYPKVLTALRSVVPGIKVRHRNEADVPPDSIRLI